jgi:hypothetical protein
MTRPDEDAGHLRGNPGNNTAHPCGSSHKLRDLMAWRALGPLFAEVLRAKGLSEQRWHVVCTPVDGKKKT